MIGIYAPGFGWVHSYEDTACGRGSVLFTLKPAAAKSFPGPSEALEFWRTQSKTVPMRPDGKPNRPLTAYTVEILPLTQEPTLP
jgi:hypothetical protein